MTEKETLLPLGSVVYLEEGTTKLVIIGRGPVFTNEEQGEVYSDYVGIMYPEGFDPESTLFFNHEDIDQVLLEGYKDEEEERFMTVYRKWESDLKVPKLRVE